ncbi:COMM domain-containing protein 7-like [Styela clava]
MSSFNFCKDQPPDEIISMLQKTNKLNEEQYGKLQDITFSFLTNSISAEAFDRELNNYADSYGIKATPLKNMAKILIIVANAMIKKNLSVVQVESDLKQMNMNDSHINTFCAKWKTDIAKMRFSLLMGSTRGRKMTGLDWKFGVTASSSENKKVGTCFIQMKFTLEGEDRKIEDIEVELSLPQFYDFMHEIEKAKISLESLG